MESKYWEIDLIVVDIVIVWRIRLYFFLVEIGVVGVLDKGEYFFEEKRECNFFDVDISVFFDY